MDVHMDHMAHNQRALALVYDLGAPVSSDDDGDWFRLVPNDDDDDDPSPIGVLIKIQRTERLDGHGPRYTYAVRDVATYNR